jgi:hypothetical protein
MLDCIGKKQPTYLVIVAYGSKGKNGDDGFGNFS